EQPRQTKVGDLELGGIEQAAFFLGVATDKNVRGLEIAMENALLVSVGDCSRQDLYDLRRVSGLWQVLADHTTQIACLGVLGGRNRRPTRAPYIVDLQEVGVPQPGHRAGFDVEACQSIRSNAHPGGYGLQRDEPLEPKVARQVDDTHAARAQDLDDLVTE